MWSYGPQNAPSGNRQHQIEKNRCRFCSLLKYVMDLSQGIWEKQSRKLPEGRAQPHSSSRASPGLHVQYFPSFPRYWQVTPFQINCWKWQKTFFFNLNPSVCPGRFLLASLFSLPYSSIQHAPPHTSLQTKCFSWVSGSSLTQEASTSALFTGIYQMAALAGLQMWVLVAELHAFIATTLSSTLTGMDCQNWQNFCFLCISFIHTYLLNPICWRAPYCIWWCDGLWFGPLCRLICSAVLCYTSFKAQGFPHKWNAVFKQYAVRLNGMVWVHTITHYKSMPRHYRKISLIWKFCWFYCNI